MFDQLAVVNGYVNPNDPEGKQRFAVVWPKGDKWVIAPCTTYFARKARVPYGSVLVDKSMHPAVYRNSGFTADSSCFSLKDAEVVSTGSSVFNGCKHIGMLDLTKDKRVRDQFNDLKAQYGL